MGIIMEQQITIPRLQKIFGKYYKWIFALQVSFRSATAFRGSTLFYMVGRFLILFFTIFVWYLNIEAGSNLFEFETIFTYYIVGSLFFFSTGLHWNLSQSIFEGSLSSKLLLPQNFFLMAYVKDFGWWLYANIIELIIFGILIGIGHQYIIIGSMINILFFLILRVIGNIIQTNLQLLLGSLAFYFTEVDGILDIISEAEFYLSGKAIPLDVSKFFLPLQFLPYAMMYYFPIQVYLGEFSSHQSLGVIGMGLLWVLILTYVSQWFFHRGLKRYESVGL